MPPSPDLEVRGEGSTTAAGWPRLGRYEFALVALGVLLAAALAYFNLARLPADTDMFWHIANGREVSQTHSIPQVDNLSWYGAERHLRTSTQEWLYDYGLYQVFIVGGFRLVYAVTALLFGALFALVFALTWIRTRRSITSLAVAVLSIAGVAQSFAPRPQSVSFVLLVAVAILLEKRQWLLVLPLVVLAANVHGGIYPLFLVVIAYYAYREKPWLVAAAAACVVVNPQGLALLTLPFQSLSYTSGAEFIQEFQPASWTNNWPLFVTLILLALLLRNRKLPLDTGLFALALVIMSLVSARYGSFVYLIALPLLAPFFSAKRATASTAGAPDNLRVGHELAPRWLRTLLITELAVATIALLVLDARTEINVHRGYPSAALNYIETHDVTRVFNAYDQGGYLLYAGTPSLIDGRFFQFTPILNENEDLFSQYLDVLLLRSDYRPFCDRLGIRFFLLPKRAALYRALSYDQAIATVYQDKTYALMQWDPSRR